MERAPHVPCGGCGRAHGRATARKKTRAGQFARALDQRFEVTCFLCNPTDPRQVLRLSMRFLHATCPSARWRHGSARTWVENTARAADEDRRQLARVKKPILPILSSDSLSP